jgi:amino acid permease
MPPITTKTSTTLTFFNLTKAFLGTGLLVIPYGARCGGQWLSFVGIVVIALGANTTLKMLIRTKHHLLKQFPHVASSRITFDALGHYAYGAAGRRIAVFAQVVTNSGIILGYTIFVGKTLLMAVEILGGAEDSWDPAMFGVHINMFLVVSFPLIGGLALLRSMRKLGPVSVVGTVAILLAIVAVFYSSAVEIANNGFVHVPAARLATFPTFFGLLAFGYCIHGVMLPIEDGMDHPEHAEWVINVSSILVVLIYSSFSLLCYAAYGDKVDPSILNNLPSTTMFEKVLKVTTSTLLSFSILLTIPLFFFSVFRTMEGNQPRAGGGQGQGLLTRAAADDLEESLLPQHPQSSGGSSIGSRSGGIRGGRSTGALNFGGGMLSPPMPYVPSPMVHVAKQQEGGSNNNHSGGIEEAGAVDGRARLQTHKRVLMPAMASDDPRPHVSSSSSSWWRVSFLRLFAVAVAIVVAILLGPLFSEVISLVGAFSMSLVAFILPPAFYLKIVGKKLPLSERVVGWVVMIFGVLTLCVSTWQSLETIVYFFSHNNTEQLCGTGTANSTMYA